MKTKLTSPLAEMYPVICEVMESGGEFRLGITGTSMLPLFVQKKDSVCFKKPEGRLQKNDIAFYRRKNGAFVLHRVMSVEENSYVFCGDGQFVLERGIKDEQIIGVVSKIYKKEKLLSFNSFAYRTYLLLWCKSFPLRTPILFIIQLFVRVFRKIKRILKNKK